MAGNRPDWENLGISFPAEVQQRGSEIVRWARELPPEEIAAKIPPLVTAMLSFLMQLIPRVTRDKEIRRYLKPRVEGAVGQRLFVEITGLNGETLGITFTLKDLPQLLDFSITPRQPDVFAVRMRLKDILGLVESCLEEGKIVLPDILDFVMRGKLQLLPADKRPDWSAMPVIGALIYLTPKMVEVVKREGIGDIIVRALKEAEVK